MKKILLFFYIIILGIISAQAQFSFQAVPQKKEFKLNEPVRIQFILSIKNKEVKEIGNIKLPPFTNAQILGDNVFRNQSFNDNESLVEYAHEIILRSIKAGKLKIGAASIMVDGKTYTTKPITVSIVNNNEDNDSDRITSPRLQETFLALKLSNKTPYLNEGVVAQLKFYTRDFDLLNSISNLSAPNFQGVYVQNIKEQHKAYEQEIINGEVYLSRVINSYIIFPTQAGNITINPFRLTLTISDGFFEEKDVFIKSAPILLQVKNIPANSPKNFYGAVGSFTLRAIPNKKELKPEETLTINVEIAGKGNISLIKIPGLIIPDGIEKFSPKNKLESVPSADGLLGKISASNILVPHKGGDFTINVEPFAYFDPQENKFKNLTVSPIEVKVIGDTANIIDYISSINSIKGIEKPHKNQQLNNSVLETKEIISEVLNGEKDKSGWLIIIISTIVAASTLSIIYFGFIKNKKAKKKDSLNSSDSTKEGKLSQLESLSETPNKKDIISELFKLKKIAEKGEDKIEFHTLLEAILNEAVKQNLNLPGNKFTSSTEIEEKLANKFGDEFVEEYKTLLLKSQIERYSNISDGDSLHTIYEKTEMLLQKLIV